MVIEAIEQLFARTDYKIEYTCLPFVQRMEAQQPWRERLVQSYRAACLCKRAADADPLACVEASAWCCFDKLNFPLAHHDKLRRIFYDLLVQAEVSTIFQP